jgi:hypothetical protein
MTTITPTADARCDTPATTVTSIRELDHTIVAHNPTADTLAPTHDRTSPDYV